jgi:hypothetical protein
MNRRIIKNKKINPKIYIFCEGESEDAYIQFLKIKYECSLKSVVFVIFKANSIFEPELTYC